MCNIYFKLGAQTLKITYYFISNNILFYHYLARDGLLPPPSFPVLQPLILFRHDLILPNSRILLLLFCQSQISLICFIHLSLPNLYIYNIGSMAMFLEVLNKVNFRALTQT